MNRHFPRNLPRPRRGAAFSLIELLVATSILMLLLGVVLYLTGTIGGIWNRNAGQAHLYRNARSAFTTVSRTLSQATLQTYSTVVDPSGQARPSGHGAAFTPAGVARASDLHFVSGPTASLLPGSDPATHPGHAIFFQAPLGQSDTTALAPLSRSLNSVGFFIQYGPVESSLLPGWLQGALGTPSRFQLVQMVDPVETMTVYAATTSGGYNLDWLDRFGSPAPPGAPIPRVLADDVCLLIIRVRTSPEEEQAIATRANLPLAGPGDLLAPNYHYDSRAWESGYPSASRVRAAASADERIALMRNQLPPIIDVAMICLDPGAIQRHRLTGPTPPPAVAVPEGLFTQAHLFHDDLSTYSRQLDDAGITHRVFKNSIHLPVAQWSTSP